MNLAFLGNYFIDRISFGAMKPQHKRGVKLIGFPISHE